MSGFVFNPIGQDKLVDGAEQQLLSSILGGRVAQGQRIVEAEVARQMEISRAPLREAIRRLEERGLLVSVARKGVFVRSYTAEDVKQVAQLRLCIELFAVDYLVKNLTPERAKKIIGFENKYIAAFSGADYAGVLDANLAFHVGLVDLLGNPRLSGVFGHLVSEVLLIHSLTAASADSEFLNPSTYRNLVQAITQGSRTAAAQEITRLIEGFKEKGLKIAKKATLRDGKLNS